MRNFKHLLFGLLLNTALAFAQVPPEAINYNGVARDGGGNPVASTTIGIQFGIMQGDPNSGTLVYQENHVTQTDPFGVFSVAIGNGTVLSGSMAAIDWSTDSHHLTVSLDVNGGTSFTPMGSTQLLSVPYALYARSAGGQQYQTLSISNDTIYLVNGGFVVLPPTNWTPNAFPTPIITTEPAANVYSTYATFGGSVSGVNGSDIIERGIVCSPLPSPFLKTIFDNSNSATKSFKASTTGLGQFAVQGTGLEVSTLYYYRAYAVTSNHLVFYGNEYSLTTTQPTQSAGGGVSFSGYDYPTVVFGNGQEWIAENLKTAQFANGDNIPQLLESTMLPLSSPSYAYFNFDNAYDAVYGKLYNHYTVMDPRNVCPTGWHVPTFEDLIELRNYWDNTASALKINDNTLWPSGAGTNESGFSAVPGGEGDYFSNSFFFYSFSTECLIWSSTRNGIIETYPMALRLTNNVDLLFNILTNRENFYSVRCLKD